VAIERGAPGQHRAVRADTPGIYPCRLSRLGGTLSRGYATNIAATAEALDPLPAEEGANVILVRPFDEAVSAMAAFIGRQIDS
jgi:hypothetical protein